MPNGENTFVRVTNKIIYSEIQGMKKDIGYIKSNMVSKDLCEGHRKNILEESKKGDTSIFKNIIAISALIVAVIAAVVAAL